MNLEPTQLKDLWTQFQSGVQQLKYLGYSVNLNHPERANEIYNLPEMNYNPLELNLSISKTEVF